MGRSVSTPRDAVKVAYIHTECDDYDDWDYMLDELRDCITAKYSSFIKCQKWLSSEDLAVLENQLVYITVSEYCGVVCLAVVPRDDQPYTYRFAYRFGEQINLQQFAGIFGQLLKPLGYMSNGETVYRLNEM